MKKLLRKIEAALTAAAFAEEGEFETARRVVAEGEREGASPPGPRRTGAPARRHEPPREKIARVP